MGGWKLRNSIWSNPFSVKEYGRVEAVRRYNEYIIERLSNEESLRDEFLLLRGKVLGCWCNDNEECHGRILVTIMETFEAIEKNRLQRLKR
jgi:hypothetical protein